MKSSVVLRRLAVFVPAAFILSAQGSGVSAARPEAAGARGYPDRPVRMIVPFVPGGGSDTIARMVGPKLAEALGRPLVIDNRAGAGGTVGVDLVAKAAPDGYTLLLGTPGGLSVNPNLRRTPYRLSDFAPITQLSTSPLVVVLHPSVPANSVKELIAMARAKPGQLNFGSSGNGSIEHLGGELFKTMTGVNLTHIPYKGAALSIADLLGGQIQILFENMPPVLGHIRSGKLKALGVAAARRSAFLPDIPTVGEAGVPGYEASSWFGVLAPAATPKPIVARLNALIVNVLQMREIRERLAGMGFEPVGNTPEQFGEYLKAKMAEIGKLIKAADLKLE